MLVNVGYRKLKKGCVGSLFGVKTVGKRDLVDKQKESGKNN